ncbi:MAG: hypothetical protein WC675_02540 [Patescibacteria group bacterium]|jgi:tetratricopeptide (TPR) repeat protein
MLFYIIPLIIILISLVIIIFVTVKKFPSLAAINIESIAQEKETKVKNRIMVERLNRILLNLKNILNQVIAPLLEVLSAAGSDLYQKVKELEKQSVQKPPLKAIDITQEIKEKLESAEKYLAEEDLIKIEEVCISVLELDRKNLEAYEFLAEVYRRNKDYKKSRETFRHLTKLVSKSKVDIETSGLKHRLANYYADLGYIYQLEGRNNYAIVSFQKAVELEPSNPRFLDLLLKISIMIKNKNLAKQVFNGLRKADPLNQKLDELKEEIDNLPT